MSLPDSFYLALCMTVLLVGAVYWVWTQMQFVQRKVNVLENIVYELKTLCSKQVPESRSEPLLQVTYPPAPSSVLGEDEDLLHETLQKEVDDGIPFESLETLVSATESSPATLEDILKEETVFETEESIAPFDEPEPEPEPEKSDDLQPGGIGSGVSDQALSSALDGMQLKELRRLAEQRGVMSVKEKKRKELIEAIRAAPVPAFFG